MSIELVQYLDKIRGKMSYNEFLLEHFKVARLKSKLKYNFESFKLGQTAVYDMSTQGKINSLVRKLGQVERKYGMKFFRMQTEDGMYVERVR